MKSDQKIGCKLTKIKDIKIAEQIKPFGFAQDKRSKSIPWT